jgi:transcriptional regulator with XRE-family HTH domain
MRDEIGTESPTFHAISANLARNLAAARVAREGEPLSQQELADAAGVSRAAIVQMEGASGNPSLKTLIAISEALGVPPFLLLLGPMELSAIAEASGSDTAKKIMRALTTEQQEVMSRQLSSGVARLRVEAITEGKNAAFVAGLAAGAVAGAGIGTAIMPGLGTAIGAALGSWLSGPIAPSRGQKRKK